MVSLGRGVNQTVTIRTHNYDSNKRQETTKDTYSYGRPFVRYVDPRPLLEVGKLFTVMGESFGAVEGTLNVGGVAVSDIRSWNHTEIVFAPNSRPAGVYRDLALSVVQDTSGLASRVNDTDSVGYLQPTIFSGKRYRTTVGYLAARATLLPAEDLVGAENDWDLAQVRPPRTYTFSTGWQLPFVQMGMGFCANPMPAHTARMHTHTHHLHHINTHADHARELHEHPAAPVQSPSDVPAALCGGRANLHHSR